MKSLHTIQADLSQNTADLSQFLEKVDEKAASQKPAPKAWSVVGILEHLLIVERSLAHLFQGKTDPAQRDPEQQIAVIQQAFSRHDRQYDAAKMIFPQGEVQSVREGMERLIGVRAKLQALLAEDNLHEVCTDFRHFAFGEMTRVEWIYFCILHTERHMVQMEKAIQAYQKREEADAQQET
ncbi:MAG: DinB family protein [Bacteroidota bacterium]